MVPQVAPILRTPSPTWVHGDCVQKLRSMTCLSVHTLGYRGLKQTTEQMTGHSTTHVASAAVILPGSNLA